MKTSYILKKLAPYVARQKRLIAVDVVCSLIIAASNAALPVIVRHVTNSDAITVRLVTAVSSIYIAVIAASAIANFYRVRIGTLFATRVETDMRLDLFKHLQKLSYSFYSENSIGQIMSRLTNDLSGCASFIHMLPEQMIVSCVTIIISFVVLMRVNVTLTLVVFAFMPIVLLSTRYFNNRINTAMKEQRVQVGKINSQAEDTLSGIRVVKSFTNENTEIKKFAEKNNGFLDIKIRTYAQFAGFLTIINVLGDVVYVVILAIGALFMMKSADTDT